MKEFCAVVDWGTSSFRLWVMAADGSVISERKSKQGMSTLDRLGFEDVLENALSNVGVEQSLPVAICGMAGAAQGWKEAPYLELPARLDDIPGAAVRVPTGKRDIRILPGLAQRDASQPDVMRGEETILLGARNAGLRSATVCMPGTHSKWVHIEQETVTSFTTVMTGELYALLAKQSTLAHAVTQVDAVDCDHPKFAESLKKVMRQPETVIRSLFPIRAAALLELESKDALAATLSGLLIGWEIAAMRDTLTGKVTLVSDDALGDLYRKALSLAGTDVEFLISDDMVREGLFTAAKQFWPLNEKRGLE